MPSSTVNSDAMEIARAARSRVDTKWDMTQGYATEAWTLLMGSLENLINESWGNIIGWSEINPFSVNLWGSLNAGEILSNLFPNAPEIDTTITDPPADPPEPSYGEPPTKTTYEIPSVPTIHEFTIPDVPTLNIPTFSETIGIDTSVVPSVSIDQGALNYDSSLLDALKEKLEYDIENGGTGLSATVEDAIWQRENEREAQALADAVDKLEDSFARKGFMLPQGVLAEQITTLHKEYEFKRLDRAREIAIKQAELEQENIKHRLQLASEIERHLSDLWEKTQTRILNASVKIAEFAYESFKSYLAKYNAAIEAYKAKAEVYKNIIQGEILKVEAFKGEIEGLKAIAQLDEVKIKAYTSQIEGIKALIETYKAEVQAYVAQIEGERAKIDIYKARIDAWSAKVKAVVDVFLGKVDSARSYAQSYAAIENVNINGLGESVRAYAAQINAQANLIEGGIRANVDNKQIAVEAMKSMATIYANIFSAMALSISTQVHLQGTGQATESYQEQYSGSL